MKRLTLVTVIVATLALVQEGASECKHHDPDEGEISCDRVPKEACRQVGYENTSFPTPLYKSAYEPSGTLTYEVLSTLLTFNCSNYVPVKHFICAAAFPLCVPNLFHQIKPCRQFCVAVRESCSRELEPTPWPSELDCENYPPHGTEICVWNGGPVMCTDDSTPPPSNIPPTDPTPTSMDTLPTSSQVSSCTSNLVRYHNSSGIEFGGIDNCGESCLGAFFDQDQQDFALIWITVWSLVCLLATVTSFLTYIVNFRQIQSPESSIYYISLCYGCLALGYTVSIAVGREKLFCDANFTNGNNESALITNGLDVPLCAAIFSILYYSSMCAWIWWALLATEWIICTLTLRPINYKWRICFHGVGWGVPLVFSFTALFIQLFSGDPVMRTCWIDHGQELWFVVGPLLLLLLYCSLVVVVTFGRIVQLQVRPKGINIIPRDQVIKLNVLIRVGLYINISLLPLGAVFGFHWYRYWYRNYWEEWVIHCSNDDCTEGQEPKFAVFMLQIAASLFMGVVTPVWVAAKRTSFLAWKQVLCICCERRSMTPKDTDTHPHMLKHSESEVPSTFVYTDSSL